MDHRLSARSAREPQDPDRGTQAPNQSQNAGGYTPALKWTLPGGESPSRLLTVGTICDLRLRDDSCESLSDGERRGRDILPIRF